MYNQQPAILQSDLYREIFKANQAVQEIYEVKNDIIRINQQAAEEREAAEQKRIARTKHQLLLAVILPVPLLFVSTIILAILGAIMKQPIIDWFFNYVDIPTLLFFVFPIISLLLSFPLLPLKNKDHIARAESLEEKAASLEYKIQELVSNNRQNVAILAPEYRFPEASAYIVRLFELERVSTLPEAYDKTEAQIHRWRMETAMSVLIHTQITQLSMLQEIEHNTIWL